MDLQAYNPQEEVTWRENVMSELTEIKFQTKKTNGSVAELKIWQARMLGALSILSFFVIAIVMPIVVVLLTNYLK